MQPCIQLIVQPGGIGPLDRENKGDRESYQAPSGEQQTL